MWRNESHQETLSFKLQWSSWNGGRLATTLTYIHQPKGSTDTTVNAIFYVHCNINQKPVDFLLDSGAAISVIHHAALPGDTNITGATTTAVSANGALLDITGQVTLSVTLGPLSVTHKLDCLLGTDFYNNTKLLWIVKIVYCV